MSLVSAAFIVVVLVVIIILIMMLGDLVGVASTEGCIPTSIH